MGSCNRVGADAPESDPTNPRGSHPLVVGVTHSAPSYAIVKYQIILEELMVNFLHNNVKPCLGFITQNVTSYLPTHMQPYACF